MAHVMSYKEIALAADNGSVVWLEMKDKEKIVPYMFDGVDFWDISGTKYLLLAECDEECLDYNWHYRLWNYKPTEKERRATLWNKNPYGDDEDDA